MLYWTNELYVYWYSVFYITLITDDKYRVMLTGQKNDYINASLIEVSVCNDFIRFKYTWLVWNNALNFFYAS